MSDAKTEARQQKAAGEQPAIIELIGINKSFGAVRANRDISLSVAKGAIHGIVGENGAGKSTLMSILYGFYQADSGEIKINGKTVNITNSREAIAAGIGMVHQHFMLVDNFTVIENIVLGAEEGPWLGVSLAKARKVLAELAGEYELDVDPDALISDLSVGFQQRVEILKALFRGADILILDEPTGVLTPSEADHLFRIFDQLRAQGKTIILITHKLREIMAITDTVSVMRQGQMTAEVKTSETSPAQLAELMVGRPILLKVDKQDVEPGEVVLKVDHLRVVDEKGVERVKDVSLQVRAGEIVGIAGVAGNGQSELLETIAGIRKARSGRLEVSGEVLDVSTAVGAHRLRELKVSHVPEDRHKMGLVMPFEEWENSILGFHDKPENAGPILIKKGHVMAQAIDQMEKFDVRPGDPHLVASSFSGGNQQKVVLAREMDCKPKLLLVGQPTRGVDIGAIEFIHKKLIAMRDQGDCVLLVSVELEEILSLADRIVVMFDGRIVGERIASKTNERELGMLMAGMEDIQEEAS
jgi:simple sugar transport system ATP-binding protein